MPRLAYVNGHYRPLSRAQISIQDRGFQFADSVYEVIGARFGIFLDYDLHMDRLNRSLASIALALPVTRRVFDHLLRETMRRNQLKDGLVYIQISRGAAPRDHAFPGPDTAPTLVIIAKPYDWSAADRRSSRGIAVVTSPDLRWKRCDIKATALLANVLAKEDAHQRGAGEVWFLDDAGMVTEGASSNAWIVDRAGTAITHPLNSEILDGITRHRFMALIREAGIRVEEKKFSLAEALSAREAFTTSATNIGTAVLTLNGQIIGNGEPGALSTQIRKLYWQRSIPAEFFRTCSKCMI